MESLGINFFNFFVYIGLFFILYLILDKVFLKKLLKVLEERQKELSLGLKNSKESQKTLDASKNESQKIIEGAKKEANTIIINAKVEADVEYKNIVESARAKARSILMDYEKTVAYYEKSREID